MRFVLCALIQPQVVRCGQKRDGRHALNLSFCNRELRGCWGARALSWPWRNTKVRQQMPGEITTSASMTLQVVNGGDTITIVPQLSHLLSNSERRTYDRIHRTIRTWNV